MPEIGPVDWSVVPESLSWLIESAKKYKNIRFDDEIFGFTENISHEELEYLKSVVEKMSEKMSYDELKRLMDECSRQNKQQEAFWVIYFLCLILDTLDIKFE